MGVAAIPQNEDARLRSLLALGILDTAPEAEFDALVQAASLVCDAPISLISLIDRDRQWFKANVGLPDASQTDRGSAFCAHAIHSAELLEVPDATLDARFRDNVLVTGEPDIRFYAGAPLILSDGNSVGTLCVIDREPRVLTDKQRKVLLHLAHAAVKALEGRRAAIELHESEHRLRQVHAALELEHQRRGDFLATLAHELRNPLSAMRSGTQLLKLSKENWATVERVKGMFERQVDHMVRLIDDLTEASKVSAGKVEVALRSVDLQQLLASALEASLPEIEHGRHELILDLPSAEVNVNVDSVRMVQVVCNLLVNAAKYTPEGGHITLSAKASQAELTIQVSDDGIGIDSEALPSIFGMFVQVPGRQLKDRGGLGVGLALVERFVHLHGGTISAASDGIGLGSTFTLRLPTAVIKD